MKENVIVKLRNGLVGLLVCFNGKAAYIVLPKFIKKATDYDENWKHKKNHDFDVVEVRDGATLEHVGDAFKARFNIENFPLIEQINQ